MEEDTNGGRIAAVILAAGGSTRLGRPKQLLVYEGEPLVTRVARVTRNVGCFPVVVVTGAESAGVVAALEGIASVRTVFNPRWESGMGSSIGVGVDVLQAEGPLFDAVLLLVCDQPLVDEALLRDICAVYRATGKKVVASEYGEIWGVPCLFDRSVLPELAALDGAPGAKSVIRRHRQSGDAITVPFPGGAFDVDTPADWQQWLEKVGDKSGQAT